MLPENSASITAWGDATFGKVADLRSLVDRAGLELAELRDALANREPADDAVMEAADVVILLHRVVGLLGGDLAEAVERKMAVNRARRWIPASDGTGRHLDD